MHENNNHLKAELPKTPHPKLRALDRLIGHWREHGPEVDGWNKYEWMEGGFFLIHTYELTNFGELHRGVEYIGHDADSDELIVRLMGSDGSRFHYVWEIEGDAYNGWLGDRGASDHFTSRFVSDDRIEGAWHWPDAGTGVTGYSYIMDRLK